MQNVLELRWKQFTFIVRRTSNGRTVYKEKAHLGGPWSDAKKTYENPSIDLGFRNMLRKAAQLVE